MGVFLPEVESADVLGDRRNTQSILEKLHTWYFLGLVAVKFTGKLCFIIDLNLAHIEPGVVLRDKPSTEPRTRHLPPPEGPGLVNVGGPYGFGSTSACFNGQTRWQAVLLVLPLCNSWDLCACRESGGVFLLLVFKQAKTNLMHMDGSARMILVEFLDRKSVFGVQNNNYGGVYLLRMQI